MNPLKDNPIIGGALDFQSRFFIGPPSSSVRLDMSLARSSLRINSLDEDRLDNNDWRAYAQRTSLGWRF